MNETFYGGFYGFQSAPFHITPDPTLLFPTETHRAALGAIEYGIAAGKGFIVVTGEVGLGKTTVLRVCLDRLDPNKTKVIYLFSPALNTSEFYATLLEEFDVTLPPTSTAADMLRMLQRILLAAHHSGTQVVLAVDEAQQMPEATLESLRILSNVETHKSKLLQIILVGQPELDAVLAKHSMRQLAQRVAVRARVRPLTFRQSCRYIAHRTKSAGRVASRRLFTTPALLYLAFVADGIPRSINICCDNALINGYGHGAKRISLGIVREACKAMKFRSPLRRAPALVAAAMVLVGLAMVLVGLFLTGNTLLRQFYAAHAEPVPAARQARQASDPLAIPDPERTVAKSVVANQQPSSAASPEGSPANSNDSDPAHAAPEAGSAGPAEENATPAASTVPAPASAAGDAPKLSSAAEATPQAPQAPLSEPPAASRPEGASPAPASPLPSIPSGNSSSGEARDASRSVSRWVVRDGDTVYKACRETYGSCDPRTLNEVIAYNPELARDRTIYRGQVLLLPKHRAAGSN